uniref:Uncharacterized protein n=1 Tax=uncultured Bacillota bacterium TaxID=344338 RepID=A0A650F519_9FIRM|nr:hypothetical protein Firmicute1046_3410 [uncultured Firmicutes bacterium]
MKLTIWDLFIFLFKHKLMILVTVAAALILSCVFVDHIQTYSSEVVIQYKDACISEGKALDGSKFDANEIISPKVVINANKDLPFELTDDNVRSNTKIVPVISESESAIQEAKLKDGEAYEHHSNVYRVIYKGNHSFFDTRDTLDRLIENYFKYYNEKYIYLATVSEIDYNLGKGDYDYIEQAEILQDNIDASIDVLQSYVGSDDEYRSPTTGMTFNDLINEFSYLSDFKMPQIFSEIYTAKLTKNRTLLLNKYTERKEQNELNAKNSFEKASLAEDRMNAYVTANVNVPNSYNSNQNDGDDNVTIIHAIEEDKVDRIHEQTTYDTLIKNYIADRIGVNNNNIDAQHCADVINIFSTPAYAGINYEQYKKDVEQDIDQTLDKLKELYGIAFALIDDYNSYIPQKHIECLTGIRSYKNVYPAVYILFALLLGFALACIAAISYEIMKKYASYSKSQQENLPDDEDETEIENDLWDEVISDNPIIPDISLERIDDMEA